MNIQRVKKSLTNHLIENVNDSGFISDSINTNETPVTIIL